MVSSGVQVDFIFYSFVVLSIAKRLKSPTMIEELSTSLFSYINFYLCNYFENLLLGAYTSVIAVFS